MVSGQEEITIVASDVDGTLLNSRQQLTQGVADAVGKAANVGVPVRRHGPAAADDQDVDDDDAAIAYAAAGLSHRFIGLFHPCCLIDEQCARYLSDPT